MSICPLSIFVPLENFLVEGNLELTSRQRGSFATAGYNTLRAVVGLECAPSAIISHPCRRVTATVD
ncbi:hypothetical protein J6590_098941 [Homalodisca vitripennis]|nr:hypothetical protein J6590_098941 [Homalodisca vitripennis]